ncbi:protein nemuri-like [Perca fluviatilis]|uniref:protein nemuri-like n=1 Tax=Perca fluviatilis TaxID=8168 RepID=UPI0019652045|nr:protein nemuri-like [Perca fluviatilis]XP_039668209.1 protein nemuri-like [Perca fluviatilis]XP_039668290.1 protein nemuri-like [Perca fluviatilis]
MARLCWMVLVLAFFLYDSVAAREQINLDLRDTIPQDQDPNALQQVSKDDPEGQVSQGQGLGGEEGAVQSTGTDTGEEMGEAIGTEMTIGKGGKGGKGKRKGGRKCRKGGKGKRKGCGKRRKGGKGKRKRGGKRRKGGKGKRKRGGRKWGKGKRRGKRSAEGNTESDE